MQDDSGLKRVLTIPWVYNAFQNAVGKQRSYAWLSRDVWRLQAGQKVLDIGCGPATVLQHIRDDVSYVGFDISDEYIAHARREWADDPRKSFVVGRAEDFVKSPPKEMIDADLVVMNGLLHHLDDDEALTALKLARACLAPGGRMVAMEVTDLISHARFASWLVSQDRGKNVRGEAEWKQLVRSVFDDVDSSVVTGALRIPYTFIVIEARAAA